MKKRMKRILAVMAVFCMGVALTACQSGTSEEAQNGSSVQDDSIGQQKSGETESSQTAGNSTGTYEDGSTPSYSGKKLKLTLDSGEVIIAMYDNTAVDAFLERLPLTDLSFSDLSGIEKPVDAPDETFDIAEEEPGYDPVTGEMVIYRPWGNFTIFYGDFRYSDELVPLGKVESGLELLSEKTEDFSGTLELVE